MELILFIVGLAASTVGAICGIGGGVVIKPVLDTLNFAAADTVSFLSGLTVLCMSGYSIITSFVKKEKDIDLKKVVPLAFGAAFGGILGKQLFNIIKSASGNVSFVGGVQALSLAVATVLTMIYTIKEDGIKTRKTESVISCVLIGLALGMMSSFMGIGGGPFNLVVLSYFFSCDSRQGAKSSLFIILFSQIFSLLTTIFTGSVPEYKVSWVAVMAVSGIAGGIIGRAANRKMKKEQVRNLFIGFMVVIIAVSIYNAVRFFG